MSVRVDTTRFSEPAVMNSSTWPGQSISRYVSSAHTRTHRKGGPKIGDGGVGPELQSSAHIAKRCVVVGETKRRGFADSCCPGRWISLNPSLAVPAVYGAAAATPRGQPSEHTKQPQPLATWRGLCVRQQAANPSTPGSEPNTLPHTPQPLPAPPTLLQGRQLLLEPVHVLLQVVHAVDQAWAGWGRDTAGGYGSSVCTTFLKAPRLTASGTVVRRCKLGRFMSMNGRVGP